MFYVYILASRRVGTLYIGVTNDLHRRLIDHRSGRGSEFAARYGVERLVWFECHERIVEAIAREKQLKGWNRAWKIRLIEKSNHDWRDVESDLPYT
jgi:putative endonuclease